MARLRPAVIVHYHEVSLKRGNRPLFLRHLARNLERATSDVGPVRLRQLSGRILIDLDRNAMALGFVGRRGGRGQEQRHHESG